MNKCPDCSYETPKPLVECPRCGRAKLEPVEATPPKDGEDSQSNG